MSETPRLVMTEWIKGTPIVYQCSLCGQGFVPPEDRTPKEAMAEVWAAFSDHVAEVHSQAAAD